MPLVMYVLGVGHKHTNILMYCTKMIAQPAASTFTKVFALKVLMISSISCVHFIRIL